MKTIAKGCWFGLAAMALTNVAGAHELPLSVTYPGKTVRTAASFELSGTEIESMYQKSAQYFDFERWSEEQLSKPGADGASKGGCFSISEAKTCGQVDAFYRAAAVGMHTCNALTIIHRAVYSDHLVPRFTAPSSFVSGLDAAPNHHDDYSTSEGIAFDCVYPIEVIGVDDDVIDTEVIDREVIDREEIDGKDRVQRR